MEKEPTYKQTPDIMILQQHLAQFISPRKFFVSLSVWGTHMSHNHPEVCIIFQPPALHPSPHRGNSKQSLLQRHSPSVTWSCMKVVFHTSYITPFVWYWLFKGSKCWRNWNQLKVRVGVGTGGPPNVIFSKVIFSINFLSNEPLKEWNHPVFFHIESNVLAWMPSPVESLRTELDPRGQP